MRQLTKKLEDDPDFKMPPGFVKKRDLVTVNYYEAPSDKGEAKKVSTEILDDLISKLFGFHILQGQVKIEEKWVVKPDIFKKNSLKSPNVNSRLKATSGYVSRQKISESTTLLADNRPTENAYQLRSKQASKSVSSLNATPFLRKGRMQVMSQVALRKEAALNQSLDQTLKLELEYNKNDAHYRGAAFILNDMIHAVE